MMHKESLRSFSNELIVEMLEFENYPKGERIMSDCDRSFTKN